MDSSCSDSDLSDPSIPRDTKDSLLYLKQLWNSKDIESKSSKSSKKEIFLSSATQKEPFLIHSSLLVDIIYVDTTEGDLLLLFDNPTNPFFLQKKIIIKDVSFLSGKESNTKHKTIIRTNQKNAILESNINIKNTCWVPSNGSTITFRYTLFNQTKYVWLIHSAMYAPPKTYFQLTPVPASPINTKQKIKLISGDMYKEISKKNYIHPL
jgi:hypothetical protein